MRPEDIAVGSTDGFGPALEEVESSDSDEEDAGEGSSPGKAKRRSQAQKRDELPPFTFTKDTPPSNKLATAIKKWFKESLGKREGFTAHRSD